MPERQRPGDAQGTISLKGIGAFRVMRILRFDAQGGGRQAQDG